jgi:hypothetical protein
MLNEIKESFQIIMGGSIYFKSNSKIIYYNFEEILRKTSAFFMMKRKTSFCIV